MTQKIKIIFCLGAFLAFLGSCQEDEVVISECYPAVVVDQGCGTVMAILDPKAAELVDSKPKNDSVYINTFDLHPVYQIPGKKVYITFKALTEDEVPTCPGFTPQIYPHIKLLSVKETACL